jgi:hypothetical protein
MTVASLVSLFESIDQRARVEQLDDCTRLPQHPREAFAGSYNDIMASRKMKLSLHTMFTNKQSRSRSRHASTPKTNFSHSPAPAYAFLARPHTPTGLFSPVSVTSSSTTTSPSSSLRSHYAIRRHPSAVDLALEEERCAVGAENIGLGLLEPRPRAASLARSDSDREVGSYASLGKECSLMEFMSESRRTVETAPLDGIFEVMERGV